MAERNPSPQPFIHVSVMPGNTAQKEWENVRKAATHCRNCPLWRDARQMVFGEGPVNSPVMLVGEQPGWQEDIAGRPFVGLAGHMLDKALADAGISRNKTYVTNAVKHFKFERRGQIQLHRKPTIGQIKACRPWLEQERAIIRPKLIVAMGASAVYGVFGKAMPVGKNRGKLLDLDETSKAIITIHPSFLLRMKKEDKPREYRKFVADLRLLAPFVKARRKAA